jgi:hypothetical protein
MSGSLMTRHPRHWAENPVFSLNFRVLNSGLLVSAVDVKIGQGTGSSR